MRLLIGSFALALVFGCGGSDNGGNSDAGTDEGPECTGTASGECPDGEVCEPVSQTCQVAGDPCTGQEDCTGGSYCESVSGVCLPSSVGTPCAGPDNCNGTCLVGICGCDGVVNERQLGGGSLDIHLMLDRTNSMLDNGSGQDCAYTPGTSPPETTKGCYATYALADYAINQVTGADDVRLAFDVMSDHSPSNSNDCEGVKHNVPVIPMTRLPVSADSALVTRISDEDFSGGYGTQIEGALRGIVSYTANPANQTAGREMIGVFITDGLPTRCESDPTVLDDILSDHLAETGIRTFIIGMTGSDDDFLETLAIAGGAEPHMDYCGTVTPPCHYFNVGDGEGAVLAEALQAISQQAIEIPCDIDVTGLQAPEGEVLDYSQVNVTFSDGSSSVTIGQVPDAGSCPSGTPAWYYDDPFVPTTITLCADACNAVTNAGDGANLAVVAGCGGTFVIK